MRPRIAQLRGLGLVRKATVFSRKVYASNSVGPAVAQGLSRFAIQQVFDQLPFARSVKIQEVKGQCSRAVWPGHRSKAGTIRATRDKLVDERARRLLAAGEMDILLAAGSLIVWIVVMAVVWETENRARDVQFWGEPQSLHTHLPLPCYLLIQRVRALLK